MARKIVITSGKGGVGKTTLTANLGSFLAKIYKSVLLIDLDFGLNNLDVVMGIENKTSFDLKDVFLGRCRVRQALVQDEKFNNLYILPSGKLQGNSVTGAQIKLLISSLEKVFDYVLIDCPAGIDVGFHRAVSVADEALIVTTPTLSSIKDADVVVSILKSYKLNNLGLIINRARGDLIMGQKMMSPLDIKDFLSVKLVGVIPEEDYLFLNSSGKIPKHTDSYRAFKTLAENVDKNKSEVFDVTQKYTGFFGSIRRSIKRGIWKKTKNN